MRLSKITALIDDMGFDLITRVFLGTLLIELYPYLTCQCRYGCLQWQKSSLTRSQAAEPLPA